MPKPDLRQPTRAIEQQAIKTMMDGCARWHREGRAYPESYSDFEACFRALWERFDVTQRATPRQIEEEYDREERW